MGEHEFPGAIPAPDPAAGPPVPASPVPASPVPASPADVGFDAWMAWLDRKVAAGHDPVPLKGAVGAEGITDALTGAVGMAPGLLAVMCGPQGFSVGRTGAKFAQDGAADALPPGPVLAALTEAAVTEVTRLADDQLVGVLRAARRQENREAWKKALVIAEFARRRTAEFDAAQARGIPVHCRPGQYPGEELEMELVAGPAQASHAIDDATDLATRLPATLAGMAAGLIDEDRAGVIALHTRCLSPADTALADDILAALAPALRLDQLARKAAALEMKLNPEAVKARRERARRTRQRVEVFREESGNAAVAGREMDTGDALASKAHIHALALRLRRGGMPGPLDQLRLRVFTDLTAGRNPLDRLTRQTTPEGPATPEDRVSPEGPAVPEGPAARQSPSGRRPADGRSPGDPPAPGAPSSAGRSPDAPPPGASPDKAAEQAAGPAAGRTGPLGYDHDADAADIPAAGGTPAAPASATASPPAPMPATINLVVHAGTLFGWDTTPAEAGGWGLLDPGETRDIVAAASMHPATRWCVTVTGGDGTALAHGCSPGQHPWTPGNQGTPGSQGSQGSRGTQQTQSTQGDHPDTSPPNRTGPPDRAAPQLPSAAQAAQLSDFLRRLNATLTPIARGTCDHTQAEAGYTPSRKLKHLVRARTTTCDAPGCGAQAIHADLDHTTPHPEGPTDQCNLGPKCRRHHKVKQAPDWKVEQPQPGVIRWTLPSGRTHTTTPTAYGLLRGSPTG